MTNKLEVAMKIYECREHDYHRFRTFMHETGKENIIIHCQHKWVELFSELKWREPHSLYNFITLDLRAHRYTKASSDIEASWIPLRFHPPLLLYLGPHWTRR